jgi:hypothetical protein
MKDLEKSADVKEEIKQLEQIGRGATKNLDEEGATDAIILPGETIAAAKQIGNSYLGPEHSEPSGNVVENKEDA